MKIGDTVIILEKTSWTGKIGIIGNIIMEIQNPIRVDFIGGNYCYFKENKLLILDTDI